MAHFGMALGAITATVIGGALLLDHTIKPFEKTASRSPAAAVTRSETPTPATVASANGGRGSEVIGAGARTAVDEASSSAVSAPAPATIAAKARLPSKAIARKSNAIPATVDADTQNPTDTAPPTSTPPPSTNPTPTDKPSEDQPPSKGPDV